VIYRVSALDTKKHELLYTAMREMSFM